MTKNITNESTP